MNTSYKFVMPDFIHLPNQKISFFTDKKETKFESKNENIELKTEKDLKEELCPICFDIIKNKCMADSCLHKFCYECLNTWLKSKNKCPLCRTEINEIIELFPLYKSEKRKYKHKKLLFKTK